ncbi:ARM repeat-containing protein [Auriscalpium vulgare]|uniref:ARM repeat-containing protein n=1 Tax=Auriscalpium vulgare TaxID=40419 RepID=A0ACB8RM32_9AGAM|nr:ARM repeat-containing protein [Auriscalpium vulgare]
MADAQVQSVFQRIKQRSVPLLEHARLADRSNIPVVLSLLTELGAILEDLNISGHAPTSALISYTAYPLMSILRLNKADDIPNRVLELLFHALALLLETWWWNCDLKTWEQLFLLCGTIIGDAEGGKGKGKERDDETKEAAVRCFFALTRQRVDEEQPTSVTANPSDANEILSKYTAFAQTTGFIPILGQTFSSLLVTAGAVHPPLQRLSLQAIRTLLLFYLPEDFVTTILPGTVSAMTRLALGTSVARGWANGDIAFGALSVLQEAVIRSVGDDVCLRQGAVRGMTDLDDLATLAGPDNTAPPPDRPFYVQRTSVWLRATSSQLLIALNTLTPLISHPTPSALIGLSSLSLSVLASTSLTLPQAQPLLLSFILSLSESTFVSVSSHAHHALEELMGPSSKVRHLLLQTLLQITRDSLAAIPRLLPSHSDAKVEHVARQIEAICHLASVPSDDDNSSHSGVVSAISSGLGALLGPMGGIEKWGWRLLSVLEFDTPIVTVTAASAGQLMLENDSGDPALVPFPELTLMHVATRSTQESLERMFKALGAAGREEGLFAVEWFVSVGQRDRDSKSTAALWCACQLLEGIGGINLDQSLNALRIGRRLRRTEKVARGIVRIIAELWEESAIDTPSLEAQDEPPDTYPDIEHTKGLITLDESLRIGHHTTAQAKRVAEPFLHTSVSLQLLSICSGILQARFTPLLLHALYPILHSIVSPNSHLSATGLAALSFVTASTSYASPANLLLSNFDYALDAVSRRLSRQQLDTDAMKVLVVLVRLIGHDVVRKAGDVVEECFERLDEYHGYEIVVDGLMEVLGEVVKVVEEDEDSHAVREEDQSSIDAPPADDTRMDAFAGWFASRKKEPEVEEDTTDYGPAPRRAWGEPEVQQEKGGDGANEQADPNAEPPLTSTQTLTKQIVSRSIYFLTHQSALIRSKILALLSSAVPVLPESALLTSIHHAWPFILNRLSDKEPFVVTAAAHLIETLSIHVGSFMFRRIWDDVWPLFMKMLRQLDTADAQSALTRRGPGRVGTQSAYTQSHRLYRSILRTMTATAKGVRVQDRSTWEMIVAFRRFLHCEAHEELQGCARELYIAMARNNEDAVWLALSATAGQVEGSVAFLKDNPWNIDVNVERILGYDST